MRSLSHPYVARAFAGVCLLLVAAGIVTTIARDVNASHSREAATTPADAVRRFLVAASVDHDGLQACRYLVPAEQAAVARKAGTPMSCSDGFNGATLRLGGKSLGSQNSIDNLSVSSNGAKGVATVKVSHGGASRTFVLVPANPSERNDFAAPSTPWRVAAGATAVAGS